MNANHRFTYAGPLRFQTPAIVTADGTLLAANDARKAVLVQNLAAAAVYVRLAAGAASTSGNFDLILPACTSANDGTSPAVLLPHRGVISILAASGSPRVNVTEAL
jgi:hypothetical protein